MNGVPQGWEQVRVGDLFRIIGGGTPSTGNKDLWDGKIPWISSADISEAGIILPRRSISTQAVEGSATNLVPADSVVVVTRVGLGKVGLAPFPLCFSQDCHALVFPATSLSSKFVALQMRYQVSEFRHIARGTTISGVTRQQLESLLFLVPPLAEQRRIVAEIEKQFTHLDNGIQLLQRAVKGLKKLLGPSICFMLSSLNARGTQRFETVVESVRNGISAKPEGTEGMEILKISAVRPFQVRLDERRFLPDKAYYSPFRLKTGDLLFTRYNGTREFVGVCARVRQLHGKLLYPDKLIRVRLKDGHDPGFYELLFNVGLTRAHVASRIRTTAGQSGISAGDLKSAPVPIASPEEQYFISEWAGGIVSEIEHLASEVLNAEMKCKRLRQSILAKAFSGQLVPQDPNDEPASILLERIRAEREHLASAPLKSPRTQSKKPKAALQSK